MRDGAEAFGEPRTNFFRLIVERAHAASIRDAAMLVDHVEPLGPGRICEIGGIVHVVDPEGERVPLPLHEIVGNGHALLERLRLCVADVFFHVRFHLPLVGGMCFADVNGEEIRSIFVVVVNLDHVTDVATEGRSSVAAEDQDERA